MARCFLFCLVRQALSARASFWVRVSGLGGDGLRGVVVGGGVSVPVKVALPDAPMSVSGVSGVGGHAVFWGHAGGVGGGVPPFSLAS